MYLINHPEVTIYYVPETGEWFWYWDNSVGPNRAAWHYADHGPFKLEALAWKNAHHITRRWEGTPTQ
jgi:hypothetical protein